MSEAPRLICKTCQQETYLEKIDGIYPEMPEGWSRLSLMKQGAPINNYQLCKQCTMRVSTLLRILSTS